MQSFHLVMAWVMSNTASSGNPGLSGGAIAGIVISVVLVVGVGVIVGVLVICLWGNRR